jgi:putative addiction module killer protein
MATILKLYTRADGVVPFREWVKSLRDSLTQDRIDQRVSRFRAGNTGDCKSVGGGVWEARLHFGPGYRIYYALDGSELIVLLCGGDKSTQAKDIRTAREYWEDYRISKEEGR